MLRIQIDTINKIFISRGNRIRTFREVDMLRGLIASRGSDTGDGQACTTTPTATAASRGSDTGHGQACSTTTASRRSGRG